MKTAIVCEGGGMRGIYTSGVLQAFLDADFEADALYGVSAGATNGLNYVSRQDERGLRTNVDYVDDSRYLSFSNYLKNGSAFGMEFIFEEITDTLDPFDFEAFHASGCEFYAGVTDMYTGHSVFFGKEVFKESLDIIKASCALPILSNTIYFKDRPYMDGGISNPIPVNEPFKDGYDQAIVILTRERSYVKEREGFQRLYNQLYKQYPNFVRAMRLRHLVYNHTLRQVERLEKAGRVLVVAPKEPLKIDRFSKNYDHLMHAYKEGLQDGAEVLTKL